MWFVYNPATQEVGDGAFGANRWMRAADFVDGLSNTLGMVEVKAHQPLLHDGGAPNVVNTAPPSTPTACVTYGGTFDPELGHTQWVNGMMVQTGMTTTFGPNTKMLYTDSATSTTLDVGLHEQPSRNFRDQAELWGCQRPELSRWRGECVAHGRLGSLCARCHHVNSLARPGLARRRRSIRHRLLKLRGRPHDVCERAATGFEPLLKMVP